MTLIAIFSSGIGHIFSTENPLRTAVAIPALSKINDLTAVGFYKSDI